MATLIEQGVAKGLISFNEDQSRITYKHINKSRSYLDPEEQVEAESFLKLILVYNYPEKRIKLFEKVTMGSSTKEADIIVYDDDMCLNPSIIVECKKTRSFRSGVYASHRAGCKLCLRAFWYSKIHLDNFGHQRFLSAN